MAERRAGVPGAGVCIYWAEIEETGSIGKKLWGKVQGVGPMASPRNPEQEGCRMSHSSCHLMPQGCTGCRRARSWDSGSQWATAGLRKLARIIEVLSKHHFSVL